jgi:AAA+ superfamily predicted ATPase
MAQNKVMYSRWIKRGTTTFIPTDNSEVVDKLDAGFYDLRVSQEIGFYMFKKTMHLDELLDLPSSQHIEVLDSIKKFWGRKDKFKEYGFAFKRGILLHGKPGCGKTGIINLTVKHVIDELKGVILSLQSPSDLELYAKFIPEVVRTIEPERPLIVIFEDIENLCRHSDTESQLLNVLDGLDQLDNVVYIATTNYIENLKERIINRPSRFDRRIYVPFLTPDARKFYFEKKLKPEDLATIDINRWVIDTEGLSVAHLGELVKCVFIFGNTYAESLEIIKKLNEIKTLHSSKYEKDTSESIGFQYKNKVYVESQYFKERTPDNYPQEDCDEQ